MDSKWLRSYERAVLYGEKLELIDYSPEIDANLKVTCFPTFPGHCGCILFNISGDRICEQQIAAIRSCCKSIRSKSIDWQMKNSRIKSDI